MWLGQGLGLALNRAHPVHGLAKRDASAQAIPTALLLEDDAQAPISLPAGERLREMRYPDGRLWMTIEDHHELGYEIFAEEFGDHRVSADGKTVHSRPTAGLPRWRWQRLLIAQVLPLVAALRGLEVLHASAIVRNGAGHTHWPETPAPASPRSRRRWRLQAISCWPRMSWPSHSARMGNHRPTPAARRCRFVPSRRRSLRG